MYEPPLLQVGSTGLKLFHRQTYDVEEYGTLVELR